MKVIGRRGQPQPFEIMNRHYPFTIPSTNPQGNIRGTVS
jgi:hypothetical protein